MFTSHFIARVRKGLLKVCVWPNINCNILSPTLMAVNVVSFSFSWCSTGGSGVHSAGCWLSLLHLQQLLWSLNSIGVPEGPFSRVWLSLPHLVYNSIRSPSGTGTRTRLSYIIVQRPLDRPPDLWNRMFDRHQAEITVMQFTGHSLPVHQSMSVPWEFFSSSHFISQFLPTRFPLITAIRMCHLLPVHHHFWPGRRSKHNTVLLQGWLWH